MKYFTLLIITIFTVSCSASLKASYKNLSAPEKTWVTLHPFKAKRAYAISKEAERVKDSIKQTNIIGKDNNGGHLDAFKHSYWMARVAQELGKNTAKSLGKAHEKGNYKDFKKRQLEDGMLPDLPSTEMDLHNNSIGILVGKHNKKATKQQLITVLLDSLKQGKLKILLKDKNGRFLDCDKKVIPLDSLKHRWKTNKCLVPSG